MIRLGRLPPEPDFFLVRDDSGTPGSLIAAPPRLPSFWRSPRSSPATIIPC